MLEIFSYKLHVYERSYISEDVNKFFAALVLQTKLHVPGNFRHVGQNQVDQLSDGDYQNPRGPAEKIKATV